MLCITGHNGAGKSTIIEAIFWALFGQHREDIGKECVRIGSPSCSIEFLFLIGERKYKVIWTMGWNKKAKIMVKEGENFIPAIQSERVTDVDNFIRKMLGAGYKEIRAASAFMQGDSNRFSKLQPAERQKTLAQLLGIGVLEEIRQKAVTNANTIHAQA